MKLFITIELWNLKKKIIYKVQNAFLEKRRAEEIDLSLKNRDKERFMALTSDGWEEIL